MARSQWLFERYTTAQMQLLLEFVRAGREFNERRAAALEQSNRSRKQRTPRA